MTATIRYELHCFGCSDEKCCGVDVAKIDKKLIDETVRLKGILERIADDSTFPLTPAEAAKQAVREGK